MSSEHKHLYIDTDKIYSSASFSRS